MPIEYVLDHARQRLTILGRDPVVVPDVLAWLERQAVGFQKDGTLVFQNLSPLSCSIA